jgi:hypothetical protein
MSLLEQESELREIVRLVGAEALSPRDRLSLESARSIREDYLHQNAFHEVDTFTSMSKQYEMLKTVLHFHHQGLEAIEADVDTDEIFKLAVREDIARMKYIPEDSQQAQGKAEAEQAPGKDDQQQAEAGGPTGEWAAAAKIRETIDQQMKQLQMGRTGAERARSGASQQREKPPQKPEPAAVSTEPAKTQGHVQDGADNKSKDD